MNKQDKLSEEEKQALSEKYQEIYKPLLDHLIQVLVEIEASNDPVALAFVVDCTEGLFKSSVEKVLLQGEDIQTVNGWPVSS